MKTINKITVYVLFAFISYICAQHPDAGTPAFPFLNMNYDARTVGMGGAGAAMPNGIYGVLSNPAAAGYNAGSIQIMGGYRQVIFDVWGGPLGMTYPLPANFVIVPHLITLTTGDFDVIDENGITTGERARSSYTAFGIGGARAFGGGISAGVTLKGMYHYIATGEESYSADGFALDCGVQRRLNNGRLIYGAALRNFGFMRSGYLDGWNEYELPYGIEAGISYVPRHIRNLRAAIDINKYNGDYANFEPGLEYTVLANTLVVRAGYTFSSMDFQKLLEVFRGERDESYLKTNVNTLSMGFGVATAVDGVDIKLDAAVQFYTGVLSPSLIVSLLVGF